MWSAGSRPGCGRDAHAGFTLLELLVVLAIAALLVAVVPPLISRALPGVQLKSSARTLVAALHQTRDLAIRERRAQRVELDLARRLVIVPGQAEPRPLPEGVEIDLVTAQSELDGRGTSGGIRYFPDGSSTGGRITLSRGSTSYRLDIDWLTGRVSIL